MNTNFREVPRQTHRFVDGMALSNLLYILLSEAGRGHIPSELLNETLAKHEGLRAILALNGFPMKTLVKIVHLARTCDDEYLRRTLNFHNWNVAAVDDIDRVWGPERVKRLTMENAAFRQGIVELLYQGGSLTVLHKNFPPREIKRLSIFRMSFKPQAMIETLVEYGLYYEQMREVSETLETISKHLEN